ncbi:MAG TPA: hypothetical protein VHQ66_09510 [Myxococcota bacterium]|nr:hypothetical protein [Myxococcota bacterium]
MIRVAPALLAVLSLAALAALAGCAGSEPESEFHWEEEVIEGPEGPAPRAVPEREPAPPPSEPEPEPRPTQTRRERDVSRYAEPGRRPADALAPDARGEALFSPRERTICDERVATCYTAKGGHVGLTEEQFGVRAGERLERRLDAGPESARSIARVDEGVCDRLSEVCFLDATPSLELTRREFGGAAARDLEARLDRKRARPGGLGESIYAPRRGVSCDELVAACYVEEEVHLGHTREQFGRDAAVALERRAARGQDARDGVYRPVGGAVCDRLSKVCYDRLGASASLTRAEFGRAAAVRLAERVQ